MKNPQQDRDEQTVKLLQHMFHDMFCEDEEIPDEKKGFVMPAYFFGWLDKQMNLSNPDEICQAAGVDRAIWDFIGDLISSNLAPERIAQVWYAIVLGRRPEPKHRLRSVNLVMLLTYEDGHVHPGQIFITQEMLEGSARFTDGIVASQVAKNCNSFVQTIVEHGLDNLHDNSRDYRGCTPEDPYEVLMGGILKLVLPQVRAELKDPVEWYMRLAQGIIRPVIPPELRAAIEARKREFLKPGKAHGGWDVSG